jgi:pimeloyl-ACP methyl ester carboxylesterase
VQDRDGRSVAIGENGRGPLLICPAWWVSHVERDWEWGELRAFFETLGEEMTVVRYDRPGVGMSDPAEGRRTLDDEVALLDSVIVAYDERPVRLLGISAGGPPAVAWTADHPDEVAQLILCGTYCNGADLATVELQRALCGLVRAHWGVGAAALADVFVPGANETQRREFTEAQRRSADAVTAEALMELTYAMDVRDRLAQIQVPTHVVHRRGDRAVPHHAGCALAKGIAGAELITLEGRMHPPWIGTDIAQVVRALLRGREPVVPVDDEPCRLDHDNRELVRDGEVVPLTNLEYGLLAHLLRNADRAVSRDELIDRVWEQATSGSNVVDAVVRSLRKKLGPFSPSIETVKGVGYRFRSWSGDP